MIVKWLTSQSHYVWKKYNVVPILKSCLILIIRTLKMSIHIFRHQKESEHQYFSIYDKYFYPSIAWIDWDNPVKTARNSAKNPNSYLMETSAKC